MTLITTFFVTYEFNEETDFHVARHPFSGKSPGHRGTSCEWGTLSPGEKKCLSSVQSLGRMFFIWANHTSLHPYNVHRETLFEIPSKLCVKFTITAESGFSLGRRRGKPTRTLALQSITFRSVTLCYIRISLLHSAWMYRHEILTLFTRLSV